MNRHGFSLVELAATLAVGGIVCVALAGALRSAERLARSQSIRIAAAEMLRVPTVVLSGELRLLRPATDLAAIARDSIHMRAFRGAAVVCGAVDEAVRVRYRGLREPDVTKDSVLAIHPDGRETPLEVISSQLETDVCAVEPGEEVYRWTLGTPLSAGTLLLVFERGSYHLADGAFRYLRGEGGRQPLTDEWLDEGESGFRALDAGGADAADLASTEAIELRIVVDSDRAGVPTGRPWSFAVRSRIPMLNRTVSGDSV